MKYILSLLVCIVATFFYGCSCGKKSKSSSDSGNGAPTDTSTGGTETTSGTGTNTTTGETATTSTASKYAKVTPEGPTGTLTGQLTPSSENEGAKNTDVLVFVEGYQLISTTVKASDSYTLSGVPVGERSVIAISKASNSTSLFFGENTKIGGKSQKKRIVENQTTQAGSLVLEELGNITGQVTLTAATDLTGIDVYIPGTSFLAKTDATGSYTISDIPPGTYTVAALKSGFVKSYAKNVTVVKKQTVTARTIALSVSLGVNGAIILNEGDAISPSRTVKVDIALDGSATTMMVSEDPLFIGVRWKNIAETMEYTFTSDGAKKLYARFADSGGLETTPVLAEIKIDTSAPTGTLVMSGSPTSINTRSVTLALTGSDTTGAQDMMICNDSTFTGCSWETFSETKSWTLTDGDGAKTVYAKIRDKWGYESAVLSYAIILDMTAPTSTSVSINGGASSIPTKNTILTLSATGASQMYITNTSGCSSEGSWETYATSKSWRLSPSAGTGTVYAKFKDDLGNESSCISASATVTFLGTWTTKTTSNGLGKNTIYGIYVSGSNIYASCFDTGGLSISTDGGSSFTKKTSDDLWVATVSGGNIYIGSGTGGRIAVSADNGNSFTNKTTTCNGGTTCQFRDLYVSGTNIYAATSAGLAISTDSGSTWTYKTLSDGLGNLTVMGVAVSGSNIYAATLGGLSISTNSGTSFTNKTTSNGLGSNNTSKVFLSGSDIYVATTGGLSISTDGGTTFTNKTTANGLGSNSVANVYVSGSTVYAGTSSGLSISSDGGSTFGNMTTDDGLPKNYITALFVSGTTIYVGTIDYTGFTGGGGLSIYTP
ncbi:MAG: carboxypeptidase regulatory-like domain-containing protein [Oligoflexales bacterium]|nr:carboxypeptidase regulatory-like domain-containing protein [Oligoflexales bacterium]